MSLELSIHPEELDLQPNSFEDASSLKEGEHVSDGELHREKELIPEEELTDALEFPLPKSDLELRQEIHGGSPEDWQPDTRSIPPEQRMQYTGNDFLDSDGNSIRAMMESDSDVTDSMREGYQKMVDHFSQYPDQPYTHDWKEKTVDGNERFYVGIGRLDESGRLYFENEFREVTREETEEDTEQNQDSETDLYTLPENTSEQGEPLIIPWEIDDLPVTRNEAAVIYAGDTEDVTDEAADRVPEILSIRAIASPDAALEQSSAPIPSIAPIEEVPMPDLVDIAGGTNPITESSNLEAPNITLHEEISHVDKLPFSSEAVATHTKHDEIPTVRVETSVSEDYEQTVDTYEVVFLEERISLGAQASTLEARVPDEANENSTAVPESLVAIRVEDVVAILSSRSTGPESMRTEGVESIEEVEAGPILFETTYTEDLDTAPLSVAPREIISTDTYLSGDEYGPADEAVTVEMVATSELHIEEVTEEVTELNNQAVYEAVYGTVEKASPVPETQDNDTHSFSIFAPQEQASPARERSVSYEQLLQVFGVASRGPEAVTQISYETQRRRSASAGLFLDEQEQTVESNISELQLNGIRLRIAA